MISSSTKQFHKSTNLYLALVAKALQMISEQLSLVVNDHTAHNLMPSELWIKKFNKLNFCLNNLESKLKKSNEDLPPTSVCVKTLKTALNAKYPVIYIF
jgi:hypothetical protein